jgi:branched-chain amino acid aminotransferase
MVTPSEQEPVFIAVIDGRAMAAGEASLPIHDEGFLRGDGAFEVVAVNEGRPFALREHLQRLEASCRSLLLPCPTAALNDDIRMSLEAMGRHTYALRIVVTVSGRRVVLAEPWDPPSRPVRLALVVNQPSSLLRGVKSLSYAGNMVARRIAAEQGYDDALMVTPDGYVLETPTAAFFWVSANERLLTPPLSEGILESITRRMVMQYLRSDEQRCARSDLDDCREAFLAGTLRGIQPVESIDGRRLDRVAGPQTSRAAEIYRQLLADGAPTR